MLHTQTVEAATLDLTRTLMADAELSVFNLVGGTALSLMIGHRKSIDIDLFTDRDFDTRQLASHLSQTYNAEAIKTLKNGIFCYINDVKIDLIAHQYPILKPLETEDGIRMLSMEDISAMKLSAILNSGRRLKDFVDIHFLLEKCPLEKMTSAFVQKYPDVNVQMAHNALLYHHDINTDEKVDFLSREISLKEIESRLRKAVENTTLIFKPDQPKNLLSKKTNLSPKNSRQRKNRKRPGL
jgi:hypothetical protein